jgi:hydrogenase maturation protein HypF
MLIRVQGLVQGVGFRPFVYGLATELRLNGWVRNTFAEVEIFLQGQEEVREDFLARLSKEAPPLARIDGISSEPAPPAEQQRKYQKFAITPSAIRPDQQTTTPIPPDAALCPDCQQELLDPTDRRYLYPFLSCTNCGPRFTIIRDLPIDRANTVMTDFPLCTDCQAEYDNPLDRRFHAQASACPVCGPRLTLRDSGYRRGESLCSPSLIGQARGTAPTSLEILLRARRLLRQGKILAIKGLGGFHLACDASNPAAITELRRRKNRPDKPFALMATGLDQIREICQVSDAEEKLLQGSEKPIVLLAKRQPLPTVKTMGYLCPAPPGRQGQSVLVGQPIIAQSFKTGLAPHLDRLGCMLPYTPLHLLLLDQNDPALAQEPAPLLLVMTSGNRSGQPIITENEQALDQLGSLADALLIHDRPILASCDDSVVKIDQSVSPSFLRRSRGYTPAPLHLPFTVPSLLAMGGQLKNTFCLAEGKQAFVSQHIGDMEEAATSVAFEKILSEAIRLVGIHPQYIAHDLHPQYFTSRYAQQYARQKAQQYNLSCIAVQHHHAHIAACMADNGLEDRQLIGLAFDGTGYGPDSTIWGGEVLIASYGEYKRFAHLQHLPLPGAEAAIREPWRIATGAAHALGIASEELDGLPFLRHIDPQAITILRQQVDKEINCPQTSSMGRFFDATASLLGIRNQISYEGQAAIELEVLARPYLDSTAPYSLDHTVFLQELFQAMIEDIHRQEPAGLIGAKFHHSVAHLTLDLCLQVRAATGLQEVALSGGVWQNGLLLGLVCQGLEKEGLTVYTHQQVPSNDGGLALGQLAVAHHHIL